MKILLINGPPRSGKDTAGALAVRLLKARFTRHPVLETKFAKALKVMAHRTVLGQDLPHDHFETIKDQPQASLNGRTWREVYITLSESFAKPLFGQDFWAKKLVEEIENKELELAAPPATDWLDYVVVTDCGFQPEVDHLVDWAEKNGHQVMLWRMRRDGCDFTKDSRGYIGLRGFGQAADLFNNGSLDELMQSAYACLVRIST